MTGDPVDPSEASDALESAYTQLAGDELIAQLLPGKSFVSFDSSGKDQTWLDRDPFDFIGHGTANAAICIERGYTVLPLKVSFASKNAIDLNGFIDACAWLAEAGPGLGVTTAIWPLGITDPQASELFAALTDLLNESQIDVCASGRGAFDNIGEQGDLQWPADLPTIQTYDEEAIQRIVRISTPVADSPVEVYHVLGSKVPQRGDRIDLARAPRYRSMSDFEQQSSDLGGDGGGDGDGDGAILVESPGWIAPRGAIPESRPVYVVPPGLAGDGFLTVQDSRERVVPAQSRSGEPSTMVRTAARVPVACTGNQYGVIHGSSFAVTCGLPPAGLVSN
ncbi:hypothetical protein [Arthrobacter woluwensis]|uniref:hypothetical protein n=1 Tax=Arthrobacter woluwensis TaxID=156980 RepID=UPI0011B2070B|nr:hypothetical protein [Arthrobacter woluwensis]